MLRRITFASAFALGLSLVAEGIENEHQLAELRRLGVREGQGFRFARPLPAPGFEALLRDGGVSGCGPVWTGTGGRRHAREQGPGGRRPTARPKA